jgi:hypothetical protein
LLLKKLEALPQDPSNADLQSVARVVGDIDVELDEEAAKLARLEAEAVPKKAKAVAKAAREQANAAQAQPTAGISKAAAANLGANEGSSGISAATWATAAAAELTGKPAGRAPPTQPLNLSSSVLANSMNAEHLNATRVATKATKATKASTNAATNAATKADQRARAIEKLEANLAAKNAARKAKTTPVISGTVPEIAKQFNSKAHKNALAGVQPQANAIPSNANLNDLQANINGFLKGQRPKVPKAPVPFEQQFRDEMAEQQKAINKRNALIQNEMHLQGITTPRSISNTSIPATASPSATASVSANSMSTVAVPVAASNSPPPEPLFQFKPFKSLAQHAEEAGMKPSPPLITLPVNTTSVHPVEFGKSILQEHESHHRELSEKPEVKRFLTRQATIKAENEEKEQAIRNQIQLFKQRSSLPSFEPSTNKITNQRLSLLPQKSSSILPTSRSVPPPAPALESRKSKNPSVGMNAFQNSQEKKEKAQQNAIKKAQAKKLDQIKLKVAFGQKLTSNEIKIYQSKGGTRKKIKQSRKKIQTRKRSIQRSKRITRSKRSTRSKK